MQDQTLFTNSNQSGDFVRNALLSQAVPEDPVYIATAFFTDYEVLRQIALKSRHVRLIVRLGFPTSPAALQQALSDPYVSVRYFNSNSFHPKLYIFSDRCALVGSANLTHNACISNQEIMVAIDRNDERFDQLATLFGDYWSQAKVLDKPELEVYKAAYNAKKIDSQAADLDREVAAKLGEARFANIDHSAAKLSKENIFVDSYRRTYQEVLGAFKAIREEYESCGVRKVQGDFPLRLEVDSFFSYVRDHIATGESWRETPLDWSTGRSRMSLAMDKWRDTSWPHLEQTIVGVNYPRLLGVFASKDAIESATLEQIYNALLTLHSFHDSLRFHSGGLAGLKKAFIESNDERRVRTSLAYLLHGNGDLIGRMANVIFNSEYKLGTFGTANVQELVGWHNREDYPVVNGRTTKILRYFGFDVRQL